MAIQAGTFLSLTSNRDYGRNTLKSSELGLDFINNGFGKVKFAKVAADELLVNNPQEGHALGTVC